MPSLNITHPNRVLPAKYKLTPRLLIHGGQKNAFGLFYFAAFVKAAPHAAGDTGEKSDAQRGGFEYTRAFDGDTGYIRLELHDEIVAAESAVCVQFFYFYSRIRLYGAEHVEHLVCDALFRGADNVFARGGARLPVIVPLARLFQCGAPNPTNAGTR